jgi:ADP-ribose pyrophosphatase YjhB (NUDIX family)
MMRTEKIVGGRADGMSPSDFDQKQLKAGRKVEMEHTDDPEASTEIAMDHIIEAKKQNKQKKWTSKYYPELKKLEEKVNPNESKKSFLEEIEYLAIKSLGEGSRGGHIIGHTKSGKPIYESGTHTEGYSARDFEDARQFHADAAESYATGRRAGNPYAPTRFSHHDNLAQEMLAGRYKAKKSMTGEGSRGGKIIGHTKSGKPIYASGGQSDFSKEEHADAAAAHKKEAEYHRQALSAGKEDEMLPHKFLHHHKTLAGYHEEKAKKEEGMAKSFFDDQTPEERILGYDYEVSSVAVMDGSKLLMGKRKDDGKWSLPGGRLEGGEDPLEGAMRELKEEAGIDAHSLNYLGSQGVVNEKGETVMVHAYHLTTGGKVTVKNDPDGEMSKWFWVDVDYGIPSEVEENLHSPKNVVLHLLNLYRSNAFCITDIAKRYVYETDLFKADRPGHKYLRKYKSPHSGEWVYVYHEGEAHGRVIHPEAMEHLKRAAALGHEPSRQLIGTMEPHDEEKLNLLRQAADLGHRESHEHLRKLGIDREQEKMKSEMIQREQENPLTRDIPEKELRSIYVKIKDKVNEKIFGYLTSHRTSDYWKKLEDNHVDITSVLGPVIQQKNIRDILKSLHEGLKKVDQAHGGLPLSSNDTVRSQGSYGNVAYNAVIDMLIRDQRLPPAANLHRRKTQDATRSLELPVAEMAREMKRVEEERQRRVVAEREQVERERREAGAAVERHSESVGKMMRYFNSSLDESGKIKLAKNIQKTFGSNFKFENFVNNIQGHRDVEVKIGSGFFRGLAQGDSHVSVSFRFIEKRTGNEITSADRHFEKNSDGSIMWDNHIFSRPTNDHLKKYPGMAKGLYGGVEKFLKEVTSDWTGPAKENTRIMIGTCANSGFENHGMKGALIWAKHYFDFNADAGRRASKISDWKSTWKTHVDGLKRKLNLGDEVIRDIKQKIETCEYPYQFVKTGFAVNKRQAVTWLGHEMDWDFNQAFERQPYVDIGELIMIESRAGWSGINYINKTSGRSGHLNDLRTRYYAGQVQREELIKLETGPSAVTTPPAPRTEATPSTGPPRSPRPELATVHIAPTRAINNWMRQNSRGNWRIVVNEQRLETIRRWSPAEQRDFYNNARRYLTRDGRARLTRAMDVQF